MAVRSCQPRRRCAAMALAAATCVPGVQAADFALADGKLSISGSTYLSTALRTDEQDPQLLAHVNSSLLGLPGRAVTPSSGRNGDDGNLNFNRGDAVASVAKAYLALSYAWGAYRIEASGQAWYDYVTSRSSIGGATRRTGTPAANAERCRCPGAVAVQWGGVGRPVRERHARTRRAARGVEARLAVARLGQEAAGPGRPARPEPAGRFGVAAARGRSRTRNAGHVPGRVRSRRTDTGDCGGSVLPVCV